MAQEEIRINEEAPNGHTGKGKGQEPMQQFERGTRIRCAGYYTESGYFYGKLMGQAGVVFHVDGDTEEIESEGATKQITYRSPEYLSPGPYYWIQWDSADIQPCWVNVTYLVREDTPCHCLSQREIRKHLEQFRRYELPEMYSIAKTRDRFEELYLIRTPSMRGIRLCEMKDVVLYFQKTLCWILED